METSYLVLLLASVVIFVILVAVFINKYTSKSKSKSSMITTTTTSSFVAPPKNLKCTYYIDFEVFYTSNSKEIHTIHDRISPIIKLDMDTGSIIIEYLTTAHLNKQPLDNFVDNAKDHGIVVDIGDGNTKTCVCPSAHKSISKYDKDTFPSTMKVVTPSIPFQKKNTIEIRQNLRDIEVYLNGKFFYSTLLAYVPFLFSGKGILLPNEAWRSIKIKEISFKDKVIE